MHDIQALARQRVADHGRQQPRGIRRSARLIALEVRRGRAHRDR